MTLDAMTGLYDERNRNYSPTLGRWTSQDPLGYINGANTYQFVDSSPVGNVDADGLVRAVLVSGHGASDVISVANFWRLVWAKIWLTVWHDGFGWSIRGHGAHNILVYVLSDWVHRGTFRGLGAVKAFVGAGGKPELSVYAKSGSQMQVVKGEFQAGFQAKVHYRDDHREAVVEFFWAAANDASDVVGAAVGPYSLSLQLPQSNVGAVHSLGSAVWKAVC